MASVANCRVMSVVLASMARGFSLLHTAAEKNSLCDLCYCLPYTGCCSHSSLTPTPATRQVDPTTFYFISSIDDTTNMDPEPHAFRHTNPRHH